MDHASEVSYVLAVAIVFLILSPLVAGLRIHARLLNRKNTPFGVDDWLVIPATLLIIGCAIVILVGVHMDVLAHPAPEIDPSNQNLGHLQKLQWSFFLMQILSLGCIKLSFVFFFRRIFAIRKNWKGTFETCSALVAVLIVLWTIGFFVLFLFSCGSHFSARWTSRKTAAQYCHTDNPADVGVAISDFLTDLFVLFLPVPMVLRLHLSNSKKFAVLGVFAVGLVALVVSTIRMVFFIRLIYAGTGGISAYVLPTADENLLITEALYWSMLESGLALIACCLPTMNSLLGLKSMRSFVASIRSLQSLGSGRSRREAQTETALQNPSEVEFPLKATTFAGWSGRQGSGATAGSHPDLPGQTDAGKLQILVNRTLEQRSEVA